MPGRKVNWQELDAVIRLYVPGLTVCWLLPLQLIVVFPEPGDGAGTAASGSATGAVPVLGAGENWAEPDLLTPPTTSMRLAVTLAKPLAVIAEDEDEFTETFPPM